MKHQHKVQYEIEKIRVLPETNSSSTHVFVYPFTKEDFLSLPYNLREEIIDITKFNLQSYFKSHAKHNVIHTKDVITDLEYVPFDVITDEDKSLSEWINFSSPEHVLKEFAKYNIPVKNVHKAVDRGNLDLIPVESVIYSSIITSYDNASQYTPKYLIEPPAFTYREILKNLDLPQIAVYEIPYLDPSLEVYRSNLMVLSLREFVKALSEESSMDTVFIKQPREYIFSNRMAGFTQFFNRTDYNLVFLPKFPLYEVLKKYTGFNEGYLTIIKKESNIKEENEQYTEKSTLLIYFGVGDSFIRTETTVKYSLSYISNYGWCQLSDIESAYANISNKIIDISDEILTKTGVSILNIYQAVIKRFVKYGLFIGLNDRDFMWRHREVFSGEQHWENGNGTTKDT